MFYEIVIAPSYSPEGLEILKGKSKALRILEAKPRAPSGRSLRQVGDRYSLYSIYILCVRYLPLLRQTECVGLAFPLWQCVCAHSAVWPLMHAAWHAVLSTSGVLRCLPNVVGIADYDDKLPVACLAPTHLATPAPAPAGCRRLAAAGR